MTYQKYKLNISAAKQKKALKGGSIRLTASDIGNGQEVYLHPENYKKVCRAKSGCNLSFSQGEMLHNAMKNGLVRAPTGELSGEGFFSDVWEGLKTAGKWLKDSGVGSALADVAQTVATPFVGPEIAKFGRSAFKTVTGVGINKKKSRGSGLYI